MNITDQITEILGMGEPNNLDQLLIDTSEAIAKQHLSELEVERIIEASEYKPSVK